LKIAVIGTAPYHKFLAPFDDEEWEIWPCSPGNAKVYKRVTRWFELHGVDDCKGPENNDWNKSYFDWLNTQSFPVYMQEPNDLVPQAKVFPLKAWLREHGNLGRMAASSSIALMIGYAIMLKPEAIAVFGVDMAAGEEQYGNQKVGCLIMLELARQRGIKVEVPLSSCLATMPPLYGYAEATRMGRKLLVRETLIKEELKNVQAQLEASLRRKEWLSGNLEAIEYTRRTFVDGEDAELDVEETILDLPLSTASVVHQKGTTATVEAPTRVPDIDPTRTADYEPSPSGLLLPRSKGNSDGAHLSETWDGGI
jgi:hypothetical protein